MMPRAKTVSRRILPPANRSKKPKIDPWLRVKKSFQRWRLTPGVGTWPPSRYTASMASVNRTRLRRSGIRKTLAMASNNFMLVPQPGLLLAGFCSDDGGLAAGLLDLFDRGARKQVRFHADLACQFARAQNLDAVSHIVDDAQLDQAVGRETVAFELLQ